MRSFSRHLMVAALVAATAALADDTATCTQSSVSVERRLRQLMLDLLGRPPTLEEYRAAQAQGDVTDDQLRELLTRDEFYGRMKSYHRALLRANVSNSVFTQGENRLSTTTQGLQPLGVRSFAVGGIRGGNGTGCDAFISQDDCNTNPQDPHAEPATKTCRDAMGVPLPVSFDYSTDQYDCRQVPNATSCTDALGRTDSAGRLVADKYIYFCDMRRNNAGALQPFLCLPDQTKPQSAALTVEVTDVDGRVSAFVNPTPANGALARLDRCSVSLRLTNNVRGRWSIQPGCIQREGVVQAPPPFWDTSGAASVAMCAVEAQTRAVNPWTMESCETNRFLSDRSCGCGVGARRCDQGNGDLHRQRLAAINEEPLQLIESVLRRDEDYFTILSTRRSFVNGPLAQLFRDKQNTLAWAVTSPAARDAVPNVPLPESSTWVEYTRDEQSSGVLTTAAWLYRFPTQRARVNHFYEAFLCKHFSPPAGADAPEPEDACNRENNLATRCGCSYCHATIEPTGAHWGRFGERNATYLDPALFPKYDARCRDCALSGDTNCNGECGNYVMQAFDGDGANSLGLLRTYLYRTADEEPNIVGGPRLLVQRMLQTGDLERCAVKNVWNAMLGRPMTTAEEALYLKQLTDRFAADQHNLKQLIFNVVKTEAYRRVD